MIEKTPAETPGETLEGHSDMCWGRRRSGFVSTCVQRAVTKYSCSSSTVFRTTISACETSPTFSCDRVGTKARTRKIRRILECTATTVARHHVIAAVCTLMRCTVCHMIQLRIEPPRVLGTLPGTLCGSHTCRACHVVLHVLSSQRHIICAGATRTPSRSPREVRLQWQQ